MIRRFPRLFAIAALAIDLLAVTALVMPAPALAVLHLAAPVAPPVDLPAFDAPSSILPATIAPLAAATLSFFGLHLLASVLTGAVAPVLHRRHAQGGRAETGHAWIDPASADAPSGEPAAMRAGALRSDPRFSQPAMRSLSLLAFVMALCMPVCGIAGLILAVLPALGRPVRPRQQLSWLRSTAGMVAAPGEAAMPAGARSAPPAAGDGADAASRGDHGDHGGRSGSVGRARAYIVVAPQESGRLRLAELEGILRHAGNPQRRLDALVATLSLDMQRAVPLLRIALRDADDEVRLLAHALMTRKEKVLEDRVRKTLEALPSAPPAGKFLLERSLAQDCWELGGLAGREDASHFILLACHHARAALALRCDAGLHFLMGRMQLRLHDLDGAERSLSLALDAGIDAARVAPFQAEIAFVRRRFDEVGGLLDAGRRAAPPPAWRALPQQDRPPATGVGKPAPDPARPVSVVEFFRARQLSATLRGDAGFSAQHAWWRGGRHAQ